VLSLIGRVPRALRMLLLTLAIADDVAAILVIALFYSGGLVISQFLVIAGGVALVLLLQAIGVRLALAYVLPGVVLWLGMLRAGFHPALAGVLLGLLTPVSAEFGLLARRPAASAQPAPATPLMAGSLPEAPLLRVEALLHPYVAFGIMPLFAFANAGVPFDGLDFSAAPLALSSGIVLGLVLGKPLGIVLAALAAVELKMAHLPAQVGWPQLLLLGVLGGIGFTMSVFIADLAFDDARLLTAAKFAVLLGSAIAAALALLLGRLPAFVRAER
jgi:NhaA family Na+:H+ antiporter